MINEYIENLQRKINWIYFISTIIECGCLFIVLNAIKKSLRNKRKILFAISYAVIAFAILSVIFFVNAASWYTNVNTLKGVRFYDAGKYDNALIHLLKAYRISNKFLDHEIFDKVLYKNLTEITESIGLAFRKAKRYEDSIAFFEERKENRKGYFPSIVYLSKAYNKVGDIEKSSFYHEKVLEAKIKEKSKDFFYFYSVGNSYYFFGKYDDALRNFKVAFELSPKYSILTAKIILSLCLSGREEEIPKYMQFIDNTTAESLREILTQKQSSCLSFF